MKNEKTNKVVTPFNEFYRAMSSDSVRLYPKTPEARALAHKYDDSGDPPCVQGFAVYDTAVSTEYAVAIYADEADAHSHEVSAPAKSRPKLFSNAKPKSRNKT